MKRSPPRSVVEKGFEPLHESPQWMPPAPALPVEDHHTNAWPALVPAHAQSPHRFEASGNALTPEKPTLEKPALALFANTAQLHQQFLRQRSAIHQKFLDLQLSILNKAEVGEHGRVHCASAKGSVRTDDQAIYRTTNIGSGVVNAPSSLDAKDSGTTVYFDFNPEVEPWIGDHRPTFAQPALPGMYMVDMMVRAVQQRTKRLTIKVTDVQFGKWVVIDCAKTLRVRTGPIKADVYRTILELWWESPRAEMSRYISVASAVVRVADTWPTSPSVPGGSMEGEVFHPYVPGERFHGPAFQIISHAVHKRGFAQGTLDVLRNCVPVGHIQPGLLDAALHVIPSDAVSTWWDGHDGHDGIAFLLSISCLNFFCPPPTAGQLTSRVRFTNAQNHIFHFSVVLHDDTRVWTDMNLALRFAPMGWGDRLQPKVWRTFIQDRIYVEGARLSDPNGTLTEDMVKTSNWFPGTIESVYDVETPASERTQDIIVKDRAAAAHKIHPSRFEVVNGKARPKGAPIVVFDPGSPMELDLSYIGNWWRTHLEIPHAWLGGDMWDAMLARFVKEITFEDLASLERIRGQSVLFLANHEVQVESIAMTMIASVLSDTPVIAISNAKHRKLWLGSLLREMYSYPGSRDPKNIAFFDPSTPASMLTLIENFKREVASRGASFLVHAPGTRATRAGEKVERLSSTLLDMAIELSIPIVPVYFEGGLLVEPLREGKLEFPVGQTGQVYRFGTPISPEYLRALDYKNRRVFVTQAINRLCQGLVPDPPRLQFVREIAQLQEQGLEEINAVILNLLHHIENPSPDTSRLFEFVEARKKPHSVRDRWLYRFALKRFRTQT